MLPNFFIIGAPKAGTSSLHLYLDCHPDIHMSPVKEPRFFSPVENYEWGGGRVDDQAEYELLFESSASIRGEASVTYSVYPRRLGVPERIRAAIPDARFVYIVRDPIDRMLSEYVHRASVGLGRDGARAETRTFKEAVGDVTNPQNVYVTPTRYMTQVRRYVEFFPSTSILIVDHHDLQADRRRALERIFEFLDVDSSFWCGRFETELNRGAERRRYSKLVSGVLRSARGRAVTRTLPRPVRSRALAAARHVRPKLAKPEVDAEVRTRIETHLRPEIAALREFSGLSLDSWSM